MSENRQLDYMAAAFDYDYGSWLSNIGPQKEVRIFAEIISGFEKYRTMTFYYDPKKFDYRALLLFG